MASGVSTTQVQAVGTAMTVVCACVLLYYVAGGPHRPKPGPGPVAPHEPAQTFAGQKSWRKDGFTINSLARYHIEALVLSTERYWIDGGAGLSPIDFAVGWGPLSDSAIVDKLSFSQGHRWFWYKWWRDGPPLPEDVINAHCANMHLIPADSRVERQLKSVAAHDVVDLNGYLVEVTGPSQFKWRSSLSRTDTGSGACELMWVEQIEKPL